MGRVVEIDSQNREARTLLKQAQLGQKEVDKQAKGLFANMCKALGKGPIPEPGKAKAPFDGADDDDEGDEDEPMGEDAKPDEKKEGDDEKKDETVAAGA